MMLIILRFVSIISYFFMVESSHFFGGTVAWKPLNNTDLNSIVPVVFTQSYQWRESQTHCDQSYILNQSPKIPMSGDMLQCVTTPSNSCGGYTALSVNGYCTDFSTLTDSSSSQISDVENIIIESQFCVAYQGATWPGLQSQSCGFSCYIDIAKWSLGCCVNLTPRPDGFINTSPVATVISPIRVPINTLSDITIPVTDVDGDTIRCRWAQNTSAFDECGDICGSIPGSILNTDNCTLTFNSTGKLAGDLYAVALMVEDYYDTSSESPFSSVAAQFLIQIIATPTCISKPVISSNVSTNTILTVGSLFQFTVTIISDCPGTSIIDFFRTPPLNMQKSNITFNGTNNVSMVTETWTPTSDQIGSQSYCAMATDSALIQSSLYCLTFTVNAAAKILEGSGQGESTDPTSASTIYLHVSTQLPTTDGITTEETYTTETTTSTTSTTTSTTSITTSTTSTSTTDTSTTTSTTSTTTSTTSTSTTTSTTSTTTSTTSTTTSTTSSTSTSTSSTSTSTSTTSTRTTTTTTAEESVTVTVLVPVVAKDNSGLLGLGLGLGLPLLAAFSALAFYSCCQEQWKSLISKFQRRFFNNVQSAENNPPMESNERFSNYKDDSQNFQDGTRDYRHQYINEGNDGPTNNQSILNNEERPFAQENSFACVSVSDFELNTLNATTTSFFSPSMNGLPNGDVQYTNETSIKRTNSKPMGSVLVRAYSEQERNKSAKP